MLEQFRTTIDLLKKINRENEEVNNYEIISAEDFVEQYDSLNDFQRLLDELSVLLEQASQYKTLKEIEPVLHKIHIKYSDYIWHINEIHECVKKTIVKLS